MLVIHPYIVVAALLLISIWMGVESLILIVKASWFRAMGYKQTANFMIAAAVLFLLLMQFFAFLAGVVW